MQSELELYRWYVNSSTKVPAYQQKAFIKSITLIFQIITKYVSPISGKIGLEVGCGRNGLFPLFQRQGVSLIESDIIYDALHEIKNSGGENVVVASVNNLPFQDESFDFVFCKGVIHHLSDIEGALAEMVRTLKKDGFILIAEPNKDHFFSSLIGLLPSRLQLTLRQGILPKVLKGYVRATEYEQPLKSRQIKELLQKQGVSQIDVFFDTTSPPYFSKGLSFAWNLVNKPLTKIFPYLSKRLAYQHITSGKRKI